jgi:hypothetical protein
VRPVPPWSDGPLVPRTALRRPCAGGAGDRVDHPQPRAVVVSASSDDFTRRAPTRR